MDNIKQAYIEELEQRLNDSWIAVRELEERIKHVDAETGNRLYVKLNALREQNDQTREKLQELRESEHDDWQQMKEELEQAWEDLRKGLNKMAKSLGHQWDSWKS